MSGKKGRHQAHEEHVDESWLVPYADILTLLLALFIVLFASSSADLEKLAELSGVFRGAFSPGSMEPGGDSEEPGFAYEDPDNAGFPSATQPSPTSPSSEDGLGPGEGPSGMMGNIYDSLQGYIAVNNLENTVKVEYNGEQITLTLQNDIMFASGSDQLTAEMEEKGRILAQILKENQNSDNPFEIIVTGHTDSVQPGRNSRFPSNDHLSAYRAVEFMLFLIDESGLDPIYFSSRGYGERYPLDDADNNTVEGRARNRRVELLISQNKEQSDVEGEGTD